MSISKKCEITLDILKGELPEEFNKADLLNKALSDFYKKKNPEYKGEPNITVYDLTPYGDYVEFTMYSTRDVNLDFQVELLQEYMSDTGLDYEITLDSWIQAEYP